jgi:hypothetical protein
MLFAENARGALIHLESQETHAPGKKSHDWPLGSSTFAVVRNANE